MKIESTYKFNPSIKFVKSHYAKNPNAARMFNLVSIQGVSTCSRSCYFCPANKLSCNSLEYGIDVISDEIYKLILDNLVSIKFAGSFAMYLFSEPLIDPKYEEKITLARKMLPHLKINTYTNGFNLTEKRIHKLFISGVNFLWVNSYTKEDDQRLDEIIKSFRFNHKYLTPDEGLQNSRASDKVLRFKRAFLDGAPSDTTGKWNNRGGILTGEGFDPPTDAIKSACTQPFRQIFIDHLGFTRFCCSSWIPVPQLGNLQDNHILELWNSIPLQRKRKALIAKDRNIPECDKCTCKGGPFKHMLKFKPGQLNETLEEAKLNLWKDFGGPMETVDTDDENNWEEHNMSFRELVLKKKGK